MRYEDWDIILLPVGKEHDIPFKEFKVTCHVVPDLELSHIHGLMGLPVMTCFVPSLQAGAPFQISIHNWRVPQISQFTRSYSKHTELVKYEARLFIDGNHIGTATFTRNFNGPHIIATTSEFTKTGDLEPLKFPAFRRELLFQNHWNAGDDVGRIKIIISEGFPRDSITVPMERVKNVVAFSFQHAPLEILEANGVAWPNPLMWRRTLNSSQSSVPTFHADKGADLHTHSPGGRFHMLKNMQNTGFPTPTMPGGLYPQLTQPTVAYGSFANVDTTGNMGSMSSMQFPHMSQLAQAAFQGMQAANSSYQMPLHSKSVATGSTPSSSAAGPYSDTTGYMECMDNFGYGQQQQPALSLLEWANQFRNNNGHKHSSTDTSMADYVPSHCSSDLMQLSGASLEDNPMSLQVPTNTPTAAMQGVATASGNFQTMTFPSVATTDLNNSLLNQPYNGLQPNSIPLPAPTIRSRKETRHLTMPASNTSSAQSTPHAHQATDARKFCSQTGFGMSHLGTSMMPRLAPAPCPGINNSASAAATAGSSSMGPTNNNESSPSSQIAFSAGSTGSRNVSAEDFGSSNLSNLSTSTATSSAAFTDESSSSTAMSSNGGSIGQSHSHAHGHCKAHSRVASSGIRSSISGSGVAGNSGKGKAVAHGFGSTGTKRTRNFTPASVKAMDETDEPRRDSPHVRIGTFSDIQAANGDMAAVNRDIVATMAAANNQE